MEIIDTLEKAEEVRKHSPYLYLVAFEAKDGAGSMIVASKEKLSLYKVYFIVNESNKNGRVLTIINVQALTESPTKDDQVKQMVDRFLGWKLPENFSPDGGISFKRNFNEHTEYPMKNEPTGTNLFDATQAEEMVRYMIEEESKK